MSAPHAWRAGPPAVSLAAPRPHAQRALNEYVETPLRPSAALGGTAAAAAPRQERAPDPATKGTGLRIVTKQPVSSHHLPAIVGSKEARPGASDCALLSTTVSLLGPGGGAAGAGGGGNNAVGAGGIGGPPAGSLMCRECGRCRCESCRAPRALPERWVCHEACLCSAGAFIDYASCLCCVKGLYYHCSNSDAGATCADEPCSCAPHRRLARWACLGALAALLPCLLCYWPLRVCQRAVEAAYARHSRAGCRCPPPPPPPLHTHNTSHHHRPHKRLLGTTPPSTPSPLPQIHTTTIPHNLQPPPPSPYH